MSKGTQPNPLILSLIPSSTNVSQTKDAHGNPIMTCASFFQLEAASFERLAVGCVIAPIFCDGIDCIEIGQKLDELGFLGRFVVFANKVPNPTLIERELAQQFHHLDISVIESAMLEDQEANLA